MRLHDLTQTLTPDIPRFPGDPAVRIERLDGTAPWHVSMLCMSTHSGTHMDAPLHRIVGGAGLAAFGAERFLGRGLVIDARGHGENEAIPASVLDVVRGRTWPGWFALVRTDWDRRWREESYFRHPYLSPELAQELKALGAGIVAIDALSVDSTVDGDDAAHLILLGADILIAENLCNFSRLDPDSAVACAFLPLALGDVDGAPARIIAWDASQPIP